MLASLAFHQAWLKSTLPAHHPLFTSAVWTCGILPRLTENGLVQGGCGRNATTGLTASGIPPHILLANEIVKLRSDMVEKHNEIVEKLDEMPSQIKVLLLENFTVNGAIPITADQVTQMLNGLKSSLLEALENNARAIRCNAVPLNDASVVITNALTLTGNANIAHLWGGKFHPVPEGFRFPV
jgi:hypothetical protein